MFSTNFLYNNKGPVAPSMVGVNQRLIPWQRIGFDTAYPMVKVNHALSNSSLTGHRIQGRRKPKLIIFSEKYT